MARSDKDIDILIDDARNGAIQLVDVLKMSEGRIDGVNKTTHEIAQALEPVLDETLTAMRKLASTSSALAEDMAKRSRLLEEAESAARMSATEGRAYVRKITAYGETALHSVLEKRPADLERQPDQYGTEFTNLFGTLAKLQDDLMEHFHPTSERSDEVGRAVQVFSTTHLPERTRGLDEASGRVVPTLAVPHRDLVEAASASSRAAKDGANALIEGVDGQTRKVSERLQALFGFDTGNARHMLDEGRAMLDRIAELMQFLQSTAQQTDDKLSPALADTARAIEGLQPVLASMEAVHRLGVA